MLLRFIMVIKGKITDLNDSKNKEKYEKIKLNVNIFKKIIQKNSIKLSGY